MNPLIEIIKKLITNPKVEAMAILFITNFITKKITMSEETPQTKQPLYLPRGSVRAILAILLTVIMGVSFYFPEKMHVPDELMAMWLFVIGYYIGYRSDNAQTKEIKF